MPLLSEVHPEASLDNSPVAAQKEQKICWGSPISYAQNLHLRARRVVGRAGQVPSLSCRPDSLAKAFRAARWLIPRTHVWRNREAPVSGAEETGQGREGEPVLPALGPSARAGGASAPRPPGSLSAAAVSPRQAGKAACLNPSAAPALLSAPESSILPSPPAWLA